jgi:hypothetical protein
MLDFTNKKHTGEPPARLLAQMHLKFGAAGLPKALANELAPYMASIDELDEKLLEELKAVASLPDWDRYTPDQAADFFKEVIEERRKSTDNEGEVDANATAKGGSLLSAAIAVMRGKGPTMTKHHGGGLDFSGPDVLRAKMVDGLLARIDPKHTPTMGREYAQMRLPEMAMAFCRANGLRPMNTDAAIEAVMSGRHSTSDFPLILGDTVNRSLARIMGQRTPDIVRAASRRSAVDYRPSRALTLSQAKAVSEVGEAAEIPFTTMDEKGEANPVPRDFGGRFNISNKAIRNDDLGAFQKIPQHMSDACVRLQRDVLLAPLLANSGLGENMADGQPVFHASHGNLAGTGAVISVDSLSLARTAMRKQKGLAGEILALEPWGLVVPAELETAAQKVLADLMATKVADANPFSGQLELIVEPGLTSATAWYLIANPSTYEGLVWATLEGMEGPRVESKPGWEHLGFEFRVVWALDAAFTEHATWYRNPGA